MPGFVVTRGLGPGATPSNLIARGFVPAEEIVRFARGARRFAKKVVTLMSQPRVSRLNLSN